MYVVLATLLTSLLVSSLSAQVVYAKTERAVVEQRFSKAAKKNPERFATLKELFLAAGCSSQLTTKDVRGSRLPNVICVLPGETPEQIVVGGHFDKVEAGDGAVDNWSGASLLPTLYESLKQHPRKHTYVFIGFAAEEEGLVGSKYYVNKLRKEERALIHAMVNLDTIALGPLEVWVNGSDKRMVQLAANVAHAVAIPIKGMNVEKVGTSDSQSFREHRIPVIDFHSITNDTFPILHSHRDTLSAANLDEYYKSYQLITAYLAYLDQQLPLPEK
jgi:Zn-dependent M28 family amino/carboxypeptidase